jgi:hypothetical protein
MVQAQVAADPTADATQADPNASAADPAGGQAPGDVQGQAGAAGTESGQAPDGGGTGAEARAPLSLADLSDDDLIAQLRERKNGDGLSLEDRLRKSGADQAIARQRAEAGKVENVQRRTARFLQTHGIDPADASREELGELNALSALAEQDALGRIGRAWVQATADEFSVLDRTLLEDSLAAATDDPSGIDALASRMWIAAREATRLKTLAESSLKDVPEGSQLRAEINAEAQRLADAELSARALAASRPDSPPTAPIGAPPSSNLERYRSMSTEEAARLPDADFADYKRVLMGVS